MVNMDKQDEVYAWLADQKDQMVNLLEDIVNIDSGSFDKSGVDAVGERITALLQENGIQVTRIPIESYGDVFKAESNVNCRKPILLTGHRDTVFTKGEAALRPFEIKNNRAYGPGVADMKAGLVMNTFLLLAFNRIDPQVPIAMIMTGDEEIGSLGSKEHIIEESRNALAVFNAEPARASGNFVNERKGDVEYRVEVFGRAAHSGAEFSQGISAIHELAYKIVSLHELTRVVDGITVNVGLISGGDALSTIAPLATAEFQIRFITEKQRAELTRSIDEIFATSNVPGTSFKLTQLCDYIPLTRTPQNDALSAFYIEAAKEMGVILTAESSGGAADSGFSSSVGVATICAVGPIGGRAHTIEEYVELSSLPERAVIAARTIYKMIEKR
ncbi:M20 family metallopeptidase [Brucella intermedia]|uniref:M20 family metallopeptidase n=1 Tax=Brucella intermedia TaxID=94625 RepID=UPI002795E5DF|nr:M20 family metallopeptidase [Brucella intermedia]